MRVNDVEVKRVGAHVQVTVITDNIPARALLDRGEAFMLADAIRDLARRTELA